MSTPTVSVIINCFNSATYLREALENVIVQSFQDWELVFWDNQSSDQSAEIFKSFNDSRFTYFRAETHTNLGQARNLAVSKANGTWLAFLDCDDVWTADKLEKQLQQVENPDEMVGMVYCPVEYKFTSQQAQSSPMESYYSRLKTFPHHKKMIYNDLLEGNFIIFSTLLIRRDLYIKVGGINDTLSQNEDYDLVLKASRIAPAVCIDSVCAIYRIHESNNSHKQSELSYQENTIIFRMLPSDKKVIRALKLNASRYAVYMMSSGRIVEGIKLLVIHGTLVWAFKRCCTRLFDGVRRIYHL